MSEMSPSFIGCTPFAITPILAMAKGHIKTGFPTPFPRPGLRTRPCPDREDGDGRHGCQRGFGPREGKGLPTFWLQRNVVGAFRLRSLNRSLALEYSARRLIRSVRPDRVQLCAINRRCCQFRWFSQT